MLLVVTLALATERNADTADFKFVGLSGLTGLGGGGAIAPLTGKDFADVVLGQPGADYPSTGLPETPAGGFAYVVRSPESLAKNGGVPLQDSDADTIVYSTSSDAQFGGAMRAVPDLDGDTFGEIVIGAPGTLSGGVEVGAWCLFDLPAAGTFTCGDLGVGDEGTEELGLGASFAAIDWNGDGDQDLVVGTPSKDGGNGGIHVYTGLAVGDTTPTYQHTGSYTGEAAGTALVEGYEWWTPGNTTWVGAPGRVLTGTGSGVVYGVQPGLATEWLEDAACTISGTGADEVYGLGNALASFIPDYGDPFALVACGTDGQCLVYIMPCDGGDMDADDAEWRITGGSGALVIANVGDVDEDGSEDLLIGDPGADPDGVGGAEGAAYLFLGDRFPGTGGSYALADADVVFTGEAAGDLFGTAVAGGDANGDGKDDLLITAPGADIDSEADRGAAYLFYGPFERLEGDRSLSLANVMVYGDDADDWMGFAVSGVGDVNCDGVPDMAFGATGADESTIATGAAYLLFGPTSESASVSWLDTVMPGSDTDVNIFGESAFDGFGSAITGLGDVDGDGCDDLAVASVYDDDAGTGAGAVYVFYGTPAWPGVLYATDADAKFLGVRANDNFGSSLAGGADLTGDGTPDLVVGAWRYEYSSMTTDGGGAFVFAGSAAWSSTYSASTATCLYYGPQPGERAGRSVATGFDFNGDGSADLAVGAEYHDDGAALDAGMVYVDYLTACGGTTNLGTVDFRVRGAYANSRLGTSIAGGPIDPGTDAYDDLLVGAYRSYDLPGTSYAYWVPGRASGGPSSRPAAA